jgi:hypothetical protein
MAAVAQLVEAVFQRKLRAALFTRFPEKYVREIIVPKLAGMGIEVTRIVDYKTATSAVDVSDVDYVFGMFENGSHGDSNLAQKAAQRAGKRYIPLSRKAALWPKFDGLPDPVEAPRTGGPADLEAALREYIDLWMEGLDNGEIAQRIRHYWPENACRTGGQLNMFLNGLLKQGIAPEWFKVWWDEERIKRLAPPPVPAAKPCPAPSRPLSLAPPALPPVVAADEPAPAPAPEPTPPEPDPVAVTPAPPVEAPEPTSAPTPAPVKRPRGRPRKDTSTSAPVGIALANLGHEVLAAIDTLVRHDAISKAEAWSLVADYMKRGAGNHG